MYSIFISYNFLTTKYLVAFIWTLASAIGLAIVYGLIPYLNEDKVPEMNSFVRVSYGSLNRLVWSVVVGWVIFACVHGYGGPVNRFLSGQVFIPLSRLTYIIYLVHVNYLLVWSAHLRKPIYYTDMDHAHFFFGVVFCVTLLAFVISLTVETPFLSLQKLIFSSFRSMSYLFGNQKGLLNFTFQSLFNFRETRRCRCNRRGGNDYK